MRFRLKISITIILLFCFTACVKENPIELCGVWVIDKMTVDGKQFENKLNVNSFSLKCDDNKAHFHGSRFFKSDQNASWRILKKEGKDLIEIKSSINLYDTTFYIDLNRKNDGQLHLTLENNKTKISALKILN